MKRALVTGGSGTIGAAICRALAAAGHFVYVHAHRHAGRGRAVAAGIVAIPAGTRPRWRSTSPTATRAGDALRSACSTDGPMQMLVNNAGVHDDAPLAGMSDAQWDGVIDVVLQRLLQRDAAAAAADDGDALGHG